MYGHRVIVLFDALVNYGANIIFYSSLAQAYEEEIETKNVSELVLARTACELRLLPLLFEQFNSALRRDDVSNYQLMRISTFLFSHFDLHELTELYDSSSDPAIFLRNTENYLAQKNIKIPKSRSDIVGYIGNGEISRY